MGLARRLELLIFELRLAGVPAEMLARSGRRSTDYSGRGRDAVKGGRRTEQAMRRSREQLR